MSVLIINDGGIGVLNALVTQHNNMVADMAAAAAAITQANLNFKNATTTTIALAPVSQSITLKR